ncbi:hypothetical protein MLD38_018592 [Melastoma candidum]|uniref:Uncharacterized protein n=1 Tax=Melastoma candidum TaxID=119954 RepID=A0ACB9R2J8_9MYRT|nr:hypothetical protein MLD38_018592 [Melastoma candidum]
MATAVQFLAVFALVSVLSAPVRSADPSQLQDFCVAIKEPNNAVFVNGKFCKNPNLATPNDFLFTGLQVPRHCLISKKGSQSTRCIASIS